MSETNSTKSTSSLSLGQPPISVAISLSIATDKFGYTKVSEAIQSAYDSDIISYADAVDCMDYLGKLHQLDYPGEIPPKTFSLK